MHLITRWFGTFLWENGKAIRHILFPKEPKEIAKRLWMVEEGEILREEDKLVSGLAEVFVTEKRLRKLGNFLEAAIDIEPSDYGFEQSLLREAMLELGKMKMREVGEDIHLIQAIGSIDVLNRTINLLSERLHEWYDFHFPELKMLVKEDEYLRLVAELTSRKEITEKNPDLEIESIGCDLSEEDRLALSSLALHIQSLNISKNALEKYLERKMERLAPNISCLTGPVLGARLIALAGSLERFARMPSGTIQILGAETSFFRHLKTGSRSPKHGAIFMHPHICASPYWQRGKIARTFAAKIAIAAKVDFNKGRFIGDALEANLTRRVQDIMKKYPEDRKKRLFHRNRGLKTRDRKR